MKIFPYGLMALVILAISSPALVLAETENDANEGANENAAKQLTTEGQGNDDRSSSSANSSIILFVTIAAIASVVGYSMWKVYKIRKRRATSKTLV